MDKEIAPEENEHRLYLAHLAFRCQHLGGSLDQSLYDESERLGLPGMFHEALTPSDFNELARIVEVHQELLEVAPEPLNKNEHCILSIIHGKLQYMLGGLTDEEIETLESILEDWSWELCEGEIERLDRILGMFVAERAPDYNGG